MINSLLRRLRTAYIRANAAQHCKVQRYTHFLTWSYTLEDDFDFEWYCRFWEIAKIMGLKPFHLPDAGFIDGVYHHTIAITAEPMKLDEFYSLMWYDTDIRGIAI